MIIRVCAFTRKGWELIEKIEKAFPEDIFEKRDGEELEGFVEEAFQRRLPILFVGAMGIALRSIAGFVKDKLTDSPVIVLDELGRFVIPVLSGHMGGANELALRLADCLNATPVLTTATDVEGVFSVDVFARRNGLLVINRQGIREVSGKALEGEKLTFAIGDGISYDLSKVPKEIAIVPFSQEKVDVRIVKELAHAEGKSQLLLLKSKNLILGMGCKKEKPFLEVLAFVEEVCDKEEISMVASIDLKKREKALVNLSQFLQVPFVTYSGEELEAVEGEFSASAFVESVTGVNNVCERAAAKAAGSAEKLVLKKTVKEGMTIALARRDVKLVSWEA